jgi:hypothetical protein
MRRVLPFVLFVSSVFTVAGCGTAPARAEEATGSEIVWRAVGAWSGDGSRQTESFDVTTGALRLQWETRATGAGGDPSFKVWLYSAISGRPLQLVADHAGTGSGTANFADDPRVSYLVVESEHTAWSMRLAEASTRRAAR